MDLVLLYSYLEGMDGCYERMVVFLMREVI
jgi:hypothetical protein